jgi:hypothetical protein
MPPARCGTLDARPCASRIFAVMHQKRRPSYRKGPNLVIADLALGP